MVRLLVVLSTVLALTGCEPEDDDASNGVDGAFLSMVDLTPVGKFEAMAVGDLKETLKEESFLYNNEPDGTEDETEQDKQSSACLLALLNDLSFEGDATRITLGSKLDVTSCFASSSEDGLKDAKSSMTLTTFLAFTCDGIDLTQYVGKKFGELAGDENAIFKQLQCPTTSMLANTRVDVSISGTFEVDGQSIPVNVQTVTYSYQGDANGNPCVKTVDGATRKLQDGCLSIDRTVDVENSSPSKDKALADEGTEQYRRYESVGIVEDLEGEKPYYSAGSFKAQIHDWSGEVSYSAGDVPPTYSMTKGPETVAGILGESGTGYLRFAEDQTVAYGTCSKVEIELTSLKDKKRLPSLVDAELTLTSSDVSVYADAKCKTQGKAFALPKGQSVVTFYVLTNASSTSSVVIDAKVTKGDYDPVASAYLEVTGIDTGSFEFKDVTEKIRQGQCMALTVAHYDDSSAKADIPLTLSSTDATFYSDAACANKVTAITWKKGATSASFYTKANDEATFQVSINADYEAQERSASVYISIDERKVYFGTAPVVTSGSCVKLAVLHGYDAGEAAATANIVLTLTPFGSELFSDQACTSTITSATIASGASKVEFYVKPDGGAMSISVWAQPDDTDLEMATINVDVN